MGNVTDINDKRRAAYTVLITFLDGSTVEHECQEWGWTTAGNGKMLQLYSEALLPNELVTSKVSLLANADIIKTVTFNAEK